MACLLSRLSHIGDFRDLSHKQQSRYSPGLQSKKLHILINSRNNKSDLDVGFKVVDQPLTAATPRPKPQAKLPYRPFQPDSIKPSKSINQLSGWTSCPRDLLNELRISYGLQGQSRLNRDEKLVLHTFDTISTQHRVWKHGFKANVTPYTFLAKDILSFRSSITIIDGVTALFELTWVCGGQDMPHNWWNFMVSVFGNKLQEYFQNTTNQDRVVCVNSQDNVKFTLDENTLGKFFWARNNLGVDDFVCPLEIFVFFHCDFMWCILTVFGVHNIRLQQNWWLFACLSRFGCTLVQ
jgi:hypothetical protein